MSNKREQIILGDLTFKTKKECKTHMRQLMQKLDAGTIIDKNDKLFNFFVDLIHRHVEKDIKIGCGISHFLIELNMWKNKNIRLVRTDDSSIDFSWVCAIDKKSKNSYDLLRQAMRFKILNQIQDYKNLFESPYSCNICKILTETVDVDHYGIEFQALVDNFINENPEYPETYDDEPLFHVAVFKQCDNEFAKKWEEYHKRYSKLQLLCVDCHKKKNGCKNIEKTNSF